jgi:hypothetical protein
VADQIKLEEIYDKNINFLIGSGASVGMLPTLALKLKDEDGIPFSIESLSTRLVAEGKDSINALLFMHYYKECIEPAITLDISVVSDAQQTVLDNYEVFLRTILTCMVRSQSSSKKCNVFTTNYDGCIVHAADSLICNEKFNFILNDGSRGFHKRYLHSKNFNSFVYETGVFDQHKSDIPQINLIHLHGSAYWNKDGERILVDYDTDRESSLLDNILLTDINGFSEITNSDERDYTDIVGLKCDESEAAYFWEKYNSLPIVNPTKWKFHETVFEEHYYQMLRLMSYELEKKNTVLITFGFSFADEHILNLTQRSLSNPYLQLYICCFNEHEKQEMEERFSEYGNVEYIAFDKNLDFDIFNNEVFTLNLSLVEAKK